MDICTTTPPECLLNPPTPINDSTKVALDTFWCQNNQVFRSVEYFYTSPCQGHTTLAIWREKLICRCLESWSDCFLVDLDKRCRAIYISLTSLQAFVFTLGIILNAAILIGMCKRKSIWQKKSGRLLANQAVTDLANCFLFILPNTVFDIYSIASSTFSPPPIVETGLTLTFMSSLLMFTLISVERFTAIKFPYWHRSNITKKHLTIGVVCVWVISIAVSGAYYSLYYLPNGRYIARYYYTVKVIISLFLMILVSALFIVSYLKSFLSIMHPSREQNLSQKRGKEVKITLLFLVMYLVFLSTFLPVVVGYIGRASSRPIHISNVGRYVITFFLGLTSVLNPMLVLSTRKEFCANMLGKIKKRVQMIELRVARNWTQQLTTPPQDRILLTYG